MKNAVIVTQHENWQEDGGAHDPVLVTMSDADFATLEALAKRDAITFNELATVETIVANGRDKVTLPCELHGVFNFWYTDDGVDEDEDEG